MQTIPLFFKHIKMEKKVVKGIAGVRIKKAKEEHKKHQVIAKALDAVEKILKKHFKKDENEIRRGL